MKRSVSEADSFRAAADELSRRERKKARKTVKRIRKGYTGAGLNRKKIEDKIYSYRVNNDVRIIAYEEGADTTLLYVGHHDDAYNWIERREINESPSDTIRITEVKAETVERLETAPKDDSLATLVETSKLLDVIRYSDEDEEAMRAVEIVLDRIIDQNVSVLNKFSI
jgi:mRNA-degrading endonuclease RelE of RelBE toxin-antitoxin system